MIKKENKKRVNNKLIVLINNKRAININNISISTYFNNTCSFGHPIKDEKK